MLQMKKAAKQRALALILMTAVVFSLLPGPVRAADIQPPSGMIDGTETVYSSGWWGTEANNLAWATTNNGKKLYVFPADPSKNGVFTSGSAMKPNPGAPTNYSSITEVVIVDGIKSIANFQFYKWAGLQKLYLPETLETIGSSTFNENMDLRELSLGKCTLQFQSQLTYSPFQTITVDPDNTAYKMVGNALMSKDGKTLYRLAGDAVSYTVPEGVENISWRAFETCMSLKELHLPASLAKSDGLAGISHYVFEQLQQLGFTQKRYDGIQNLYLPQDMSKLKLDLGTSSMTGTLNVYYPGTAAEFQSYPNGASYVVSRGGKDNFFFGPNASPARKIIWKSTQEDAEGWKTVLAAAGESITLPEDDTGFKAPTNGSFQGSFYFDGELKTKGSQVTMPDHDVVLTPKWFGSAVTVTLDANGHGMLANTEYILEADGITTYGTVLPELTAENYTFLGWFTAAQGGSQVTAGTVVASGDHTLYAHWQENPKVTVTLDLNDGGAGAAAATLSYEVAYPGKYPSLAAPTWSDHIFDGWYTAPTGGVQVKEGDALTQNAPHTLYAHWTEIVDVAVTLDPNGGTVTPGQVSAKYPGGTYPALAAPVRAGYTFLGWFTGREDGSQIREGDRLTKETAHTLYAHWEKIPETYTLTLDPMGGTLSTTAITITEGGRYPYLPIPTKPGYDFTGWFSAVTGGTQVTAMGDLLQNGDHTVYARYTVSMAHDKDAVRPFSYQFSNSSYSFEYPADYRIPYERYRDVYGDNARARALYEYSGPWGGSCSGMATTSALLYLPNPSGKEIQVKNFKEGPWQGTSTTFYEQISDMRIYAQHEKWRYSLRSFIEGMQISQGGGSSGVFAESSHSIQEAFDMVQRETSGADPRPVYLSVQRSGGGHALLAYETKVIDDTTAYLYVYDCNYPLDGSRHVVLTKSDPQGSYDSYIYRGGYDYDRSLSAKTFAGTPYPAWLNNIDDKPPLDALMNLICVGAKRVNIVDANGNIVATVNADGTVTTVNGVESLNMVADRVDAAGNPVDTGEQGYAFFVPRGKYTIVDIGNDGKDMTVSVSNIDRSATIQTSADSVTVIVDDAQDLNYARVNGRNAEYKIALAGVVTQEDGEHYVEYLLSGKTEEKPVAIARKGGETLTENVDLTREEIGLSTRKDAQVYHDVDLDKIAAECGSAADYASEFAQKANAAVAEAKAADAAQPPLESGWTVAVGDEAKTREIVNSDLGTYAPATPPTTDPPSGDSGDSGSSDSDPDDSGSGGSWSGASRPNKTGSTSAESDKPTPEMPFQDVKDGMYYYDAVLWAVEKGIVKGLTETSFGPDGLCTRAQIATMLHRLAGEPAAAEVQSFRDVPSDAYYRAAVNWAYGAGVIKGITETEFSPDLPCTRAQMAAMLYRAKGSPAVNGELPFKDIPTDVYYRDAVLWAYQSGIIKGITEDTFGPDNACTRGMTATMLYRANG